MPALSGNGDNDEIHQYPELTHIVQPIVPRDIHIHNEIPNGRSRIRVSCISMPPAHIGIDGLWNCLRSCISSSASRSPYRTYNSSRIFSNLAGTSLPCLNHVRKPSFLPIRSYHSATVGSKEQMKLSRIDTVRRLYHELNRLSIKAEFLRIYETVGELVGRYDEPPSPRLFLALVLANTDAQHGSITEVARLLQEMGESGVEPDSATYHAVLKVLAIHPDYLMRTRVLEEMHMRWFSISNDGWHDIIAGLLRDRQIELAMDKFNFARKEGINIQTWLQDTMVYVLCDIEEFDEVVAMMRRRVAEGDLAISPTLWFYILDTASRALHHSATIYAWRKRVETFYLNPPSGVCTNILNTAARHGDFSLASDVCRILGNRRESLQLCHYESLLEAYTVAFDLKTALTILSIMTSSDMPPSASSVRPVHALFRRAPSLLPSAVPILRHLREIGQPVPVAAVNVIIEAFVAKRDLDSAVETYKTLHLLCPTGPLTATFNELFRGCQYAGRKDLAMFLASEMIALKVVPDVLTYDRLILVCLQAAKNGAEDAYEDAWRYLAEMRGLHWWPRQSTTMLLLAAGAEAGDERVWALAGQDDAASRGMNMADLEPLVRRHWNEGEERKRRERHEAAAEVDGDVDVNADHNREKRIDVGIQV